jgi:hypothetical protein
LNGCAQDLGLDPSIGSIISARAPAILTGLKEVLCLSNSTAPATNGFQSGRCPGAFCDIELLTNLQTILGQNLTLGFLQSVYTGEASLDVPSSLTGIPTEQVCTECNKAIYQASRSVAAVRPSYMSEQTLNNTLTEVLGASLDSAQIGSQSLPAAIDEVCGANFAETPFSSSITQCAANSTSSSTAARRLRFVRWV